MAKIKSNQAYASVHLDKFSGIGPGILSRDGRAYDMENFRILPDGSLKKRTGYYRQRQYPNRVRAFWEGTAGGINYAFIVCHNVVYRADRVIGGPIQIDTLTTTGGKVNFFVYRDTIYLQDGAGLRAYDAVTNKFPAVEGYVPLYGKNWDPKNGGSVYEPMNLLTNRLRVSYANTTLQTDFMLPFYTQSVESVRVNGRRINDYIFATGAKNLVIPAASTGYTVEIAMTASMAEEEAGINTTECACVYGGRHHETLCLFNGDTPTALYFSSDVPRNELSAVRADYPKSLPLYFKERNVLHSSNRTDPIHSMVAYGNQLIGYSYRTSWSIRCPDDAGDTCTLSVLLPDIGCDSTEAAILCDYKPVTVNQKGIFLLDLPRSENDLPRAVRISDPIADRLTTSLLTSAITYENREHHELWVRDPNDADGRVLVYNYDLGQWYTFTGFHADHFVSYPDFQGFLDNDTLYLLSNELYSDSGEHVTALYQSGYLSFGHPEEQKRSLRATLCCQTAGSAAYLKLESENGEYTVPHLLTLPGPPQIVDRRALLGRFRHLRFRILVSGSEDCRIFSLSLHANL